MSGERGIVTGPPGAERHELTMSYVVLRHSLEVTVARARERVGTELRDHEAFTRLGDLEDQVLDTGALDAARTAAEIRRAVAARRYRLG